MGDFKNIYDLEYLKNIGSDQLNFEKSNFVFNPDLFNSDQCTSFKNTTIDDILKKRNNQFNTIDWLVDDSDKIYGELPFIYDAEMKSLAEELTLNKRNKVEKAKAIYDWVISEVKYDYVKYNKMKKGRKVDCRNALETFYSKEGICSEHAYLYTTLCRLAGLDAHYVHVNKTTDNQNPHASAVVKISSKNLYVDTAYKLFGKPHKKFYKMGDQEVKENYYSYNSLWNDKELLKQSEKIRDKSGYKNFNYNNFSCNNLFKGESLGDYSLKYLNESENNKDSNNKFDKGNGGAGSYNGSDGFDYDKWLYSDSDGDNGSGLFGGFERKLKHVVQVSGIALACAGLLYFGGICLNLFSANDVRHAMGKSISAVEKGVDMTKNLKRGIFTKKSFANLPVHKSSRFGSVSYSKKEMKGIKHIAVAEFKSILNNK